MELISREEALKVFDHTRPTAYRTGIENLPTIESRPKGAWIKNEYDWYYHCSVCKENNLLHTDESNALSNYCPHCGAEMENKEE